jgi:hypothetical protein
LPDCRPWGNPEHGGAPGGATGNRARRLAEGRPDGAQARAGVSRCARRPRSGRRWRSGSGWPSRASCARRRGSNTSLLRSGPTNARCGCGSFPATATTRSPTSRDPTSNSWLTSCWPRAQRRPLPPPRSRRRPASSGEVERNRLKVNPVQGCPCPLPARAATTLWGPSLPPRCSKPSPKDAGLERLTLHEARHCYAS